MSREEIAPAMFLFPFIEKRGELSLNFSFPVDGC